MWRSLISVSWFCAITICPVSLGAANLAPPLSSRWLKLLHYQPVSGGFESSIDHDGFFFSPHGKTDPRAEFLASRAALASGKPLVGANLMDPQCAFPARSRYFLDEFGDIPRRVACLDFDHWRSNLPLQSISIVFSSAYSGNPASMFGHTFIKLNLKQAAGVSSPLLDYGATFSAMTEDDWALTYAVKGLTGGYRGIFSLEPYYSHVMSYAYQENRDLWEYRLDLTPTELNGFLEHFWELFAGAYADYYFLDDNCSSMPLEIIDAVRPTQSLSEQTGAIVLPHETVKILEKAFPGVTVKRVLSERHIFAGLVELLDDASRDQLGELIGGTIPVSKADTLVLDAGLAYLNLQKTSLALDEQDDIRRQERAILTERAHRPQPSISQAQPSIDGAPHLIHPPHKVSIGYHFGTSNAYSLRLRYGFHDILDPGLGLEPYYHLNFFDVVLLAPQGTGRPSYDFNIVDVLSLEPYRRFDPNFSWRGSLGLRSIPAGLFEQSEVYGLIGIGGALELVKNRWLFYSIPTLSASAGSESTDKLTASAAMDLSTVAYLAGWCGLHAGWSAFYVLDPRLGEVSHDGTQAFAAVQVNLTNGSALEFRSERKSRLEHRLTFSSHF